MIINNINLDEFTRTEFLSFLEMLIKYYYVQFNEVLIIDISGSDLNE